MTKQLEDAIAQALHDLANEEELTSALRRANEELAAQLDEKRRQLSTMQDACDGLRAQVEQLRKRETGWAVLTVAGWVIACLVFAAQ